MLSISLIQGDLLERPGDLLILKHAGSFHGVDRAVAERIGFFASLDSGDYTVVAGSGIGAQQVLFLGVGRLVGFRYAEIRRFGHDALKIAAALADPPASITMPMHGPGYGLDEREAFLSLVGGLMEAAAEGIGSPTLKNVEIVERDPRRVMRLTKLLAEVSASQSAQVLESGSINVLTKGGDVRRASGMQTVELDPQQAVADLASFGAGSERKPRLFVAMPFAEDYIDEFEIGITEAAQNANLLCERMDKEAYVGDIVREVRSRITSCRGLVALLNGANPNVFLELGYAWALDKPTVLIARKDQALPFDVGQQKCIRYTSIVELRRTLTAELKGLVENGTLAANN